MLRNTEINHQYRSFVENHNQWAKDLRESGTPLETLGQRSEASVGGFKAFWKTCKRTAVFCLQVSLAVMILCWAKLAVLFRRRRDASLHQKAKSYVDEFVAQYPFHLYPIVAKSIELAFLHDLLPKAITPGKQVLELAIGEGTLSSRVFAETDRVVGVDLSPYSLVKSAGMPHVAQAVVGDCLDPPIAHGSFELLVSNNFLHHITEKEEVVARWSHLSRQLIFNENTTYWASGWTRPFLTSKIGRKARAQEIAKHIEEYHAQHLISKGELDTIISKNCQIDECVTYLSERTYFLCSLFSAVMRCYGPPTPTECKEFSLGGRFRNWLTRTLTSAVAKALITYDIYQDRSRDVFVSYNCTSRNFKEAAKPQHLACPNCRVALNTSDACDQCGKQFTSIDGMLFLLNEKLERWESEYDSEFAVAIVKKEHL